jgi:hypothetical protein
MLPMHRLALLVALTACSSGREPGAEPAAPGAPLPLAPAVTSPPPSSPSWPRTTTAQLEAAVAADLAVLGAATAKDLLPGAPPRPLAVAAQFPLPYSEGRTILAVVGLAPGEPARLLVPTQLEALRYTLAITADGQVAVVARPARADLAAAASRALADEARAITAAEAALDHARLPLPAGKASWRQALRSATYDARLPAGQFVGEPTWSFLFDPWTEAHGFHQVVLDARLAVTLVNGRAP